MLEIILFNYINNKKNKKNKIQIENYQRRLLDHLKSIENGYHNVNYEWMSDQGYYDYVKRRGPPTISSVIEEVSKINSDESISDYKEQIRKLCIKKKTESEYPHSMDYKEVLEYLESH